MNKEIKKVIVVGGGTAGWISAALLKKVLGPSIDIELVESDSIGTVGVGEATIPPIRLLNSVLGINESEFLIKTQGTIKLGIQFENWRIKGERYFHSFGAAGKSMAFCHFHHFLQRAQSLGMQTNLWDYDLNYLAAYGGKFAPINSKETMLDLPYAYHFDAGLYASFLRQKSELMGVKRTEGLIEQVKQNFDSGFIESLILQDGREIKGDLFIDCSGFRALLIQRELGTGFEDWSHWLPCDRAVAIPSKRHEISLPYTRSMAHAAGWQWRIPLQHRNGNGLVYSSQYYSQEQALDLLSQNLDSESIGEPNFIQFKTGRRRQQWSRNVVAVGLSSGFLEPLESTSIHLIQSAVVRLIHLFPHQGIQAADVKEYNRQSKVEMEQIRDFIILHYHVNERTDSHFWRDLRHMVVPDTLQHKIDLFAATGRLFRDQNDLFLESSWLQVMLGQGIQPRDYHPIANGVSQDKLFDMLNHIQSIKTAALEKLPTHDSFLRAVNRSTTVVQL